MSMLMSRDEYAILVSSWIFWKWSNACLVLKCVYLNNVMYLHITVYSAWNIDVDLLCCAFKHLVKPVVDIATNLVCISCYVKTTCVKVHELRIRFSVIQ